MPVITETPLQRAERLNLLLQANAQRLMRAISANTGAAFPGDDLASQLGSFAATIESGIWSINQVHADGTNPPVSAVLPVASHQAARRRKRDASK